MSEGLPLSAALRFAARSLRGTVRRAFRGFGIFVACLALGVAAIAGVAALGRSFDASLAASGDAILGGDVAVSLNHLPLGAAEHAFLAARGRTSDVATLRAMARTPDGTGSALVEAKAVDAAYPLIGDLKVVGGGEPQALLARTDDADGPTFGALVEDTALARLNVAVGATLMVGKARVKITGVIAEEPDRLSGGLGFGPRLMISREALDASDLLAPGSLVRWHTRVRLAPGDTPDAPSRRRGPPSPAPVGRSTPAPTPPPA